LKGFREEWDIVLSPLLTRLSQKGIARLNEIWAGLAAAFVTMLPSLAYRVVAHYRSDIGSMYASIRKIYTWLLTSYVNQGECWTVERLKSIYESARYEAVGSGTARPIVPTGTPGRVIDPNGTVKVSFSHIFSGPLLAVLYDDKLCHGHSPLFQLSLAKRALPEPPSAKKVEAMVSHAERLGVPRPCYRWLPDIAMRWGRTYGDRFKRGVGIAKSHFTTSSSATFEYSRADGGRQTWVEIAISKVEDARRELCDFVAKSLVRMDQTFYSFFGEAKAYVNGLDGNAIEGPSLQELYPDRRPNSQLLLRDSSLEEALQEGYLQGNPDISDKVCGGTFTGYYLYPVNDRWKSLRAMPYPVTVASTDEQGYKPRIITKCPGSVCTLLHLWRTAFKGILQEDWNTGSMTGEGTLNTFIRKVNDYLNTHTPLRWMVAGEILSSDFKTATDLEPPGLAGRILEGVMQGAGVTDPLLLMITPWITMTGIRVIYPKEVVSPLLKDNVLHLVQGVLMGNPASWVLLNWWNRFCWDMAWTTYKVVAEAKGRDYVSDPRFDNAKQNTWYLWADEFDQLVTDYLTVILLKLETRLDNFVQRCGDDHGSVAPSLVHRLYEWIVEGTGGQLSPGAHLNSRTHVVLCEQLAKRDTTTGKFSFVDIVYVKSLVGPRSRLPRIKETPVSWSRGTAAAATIRWFPLDNPLRQGISLWTYWSNRDFVAYLRRLGIEPFLPPSFGGRGFPYYKSECRIYSGKVKRAVSVLLQNDESFEHYRDIVSLASIWAARTYSALGKRIQTMSETLLDACVEWTSSCNLGVRTLSSLCRELQLTPPEFPDKKSLGNAQKALEEKGWIALDKVLSEYQTRLTSQLCWYYPAEERAEIDSLPRIARRFSDIIDKVNSSSAHKFQPLRGTPDNLLDRLFWKRNQFFVSRDLRDSLMPKEPGCPLPSAEDKTYGIIHDVRSTGEPSRKRSRIIELS